MLAEGLTSARPTFRSLALQACDEQLAKQSALQLAHRQQVAELEDAVHSLRQQVSLPHFTCAGF